MNVYEIWFSPTGGTKKVADLVALSLIDKPVALDLTAYRTDLRGTVLKPDDLAVIAVPSYGGRVPVPAATRLEALRGNGAGAILVCVYGNRAYEDTLAELEDIVRKAGFHIVAAVAAVAEHSIIRKFAAGRPDEEDRKQLLAFSAQIQEKLAAGDRSEPKLPGNRPYRKAGGAGIVPRPTKSCVKCGICAGVCPVGAIDEKDPGKVDRKRCISCMGCVSACPHGARKSNGLMLALVGAVLKKECTGRKECRLYL